MRAVADPGHRRGIQRRVSFRMMERPVAVVDRARHHHELRVPLQSMPVLLARIQVHVATGRHRAGVGPLVGEIPGAGKQGVRAVEFPAVDAPAKHLPLHPVPPGDGLRIGIVEEAPGALPPTLLPAVSRKISMRRGVRMECRGVADRRVGVPRVHHAGHPQHHPVAVGLEPAEESLGIRVPRGVHGEVVVARAPRAVDEEGPHRDVVGRVSVEQLAHRGRRVAVVFPQPAFQRPRRRDRDAAVPLRAEGPSPERIGPQKVKRGGENDGHAREPSSPSGSPGRPRGGGTRGRGFGSHGGARGTGFQARVRKVSAAARTVASMSASVWAVERNPASNWLGAR